MTGPFIEPLSGTRANRFRNIRDAILANVKPAQSKMNGHASFSIGEFLIDYAIPGAFPGRPFNMSIWPSGTQDRGHIVQGDKVANVDWDQADNIQIISYRSGDWEQRLLNLVSCSSGLVFLPRR